MCGIAGSIGPVRPDQGRIEHTLGVLKQRGPDGSGVWHGEIAGSAVSLLHTRLAIIDLDPRAGQPFIWDECVLAFNGEIYNYIELRTELESRGHHFVTASDTEVIVHAYHQWGTGCVERFEGMWAFVLADLKAQRLWVSRDRFGEKPLHLWKCDGTLYFASEVKALAALAGAGPSVNERQVRRYLVNGYKSLNKGRETWFNGVETFPASCQMSLQGPDAPDPEPYWSLSYSPQQMTADEAADGVRARLEQALRLRLRSDVPLAFCLSGGIDSSALASLAVKDLGYDVRAFSIIDSDERYNETGNIRATVADLGCSLHEIRCSTEGFLDRLEAQIAYHDAPIATISYYMHAFISEALHAEGFKVAISGTAADELFTGYYDHYGIWLAEMSDSPDFDDLVSDWRRTYGAHVRNPVLRDPLAFKVNTHERSHIYLDRDKFNALLIEPLNEDFQEADYGSNLLRRRMLNELFHEAIPVILNEDDLNSMQYSVENRSPYLDRELAEFAYTIPNRHLIHNGLPKWPLRSAVDGSLNDQVRLDGQKRGFNASIESLLDRDDSDVKERLLDDSPIFDLVRRDAIEDFLDGDLTDNSFSKFAFSFVSAKIFMESGLATGRMDRVAA